jgi:chemotaxis protein methyltransferase CheR
VKVNCASLPANLVESELFGHEKGAFTSAQSRQIGRFEIANGSTIFLDEIGELPPESQNKLLRVLEDAEFERLGSSRTIKVDVRVIGATNRDLEVEIREGRFRQDLYYRLNVFPITVPPLRERLEDIPLLVDAFLDGFKKKLGKPIEKIPQQVMLALQKYSWPGNIRELRNVIERAVLNSQGKVLSLAEKLVSPDTSDLIRSHKRTLESVERNYIVEILNEVNWKIEGQNGAAGILDLNPSTLRTRMKKLGISKPTVTRPESS